MEDKKSYVSDDSAKQSYVTHEYLNGRLDKIDDDIERVDDYHKANYSRLETLFSVLQTTLESLNGNMSKMVSNQEETNRELTKISIQNAEHELRINGMEKRQESYESGKTAYVSDVLKIVGIVVGGLITLTGTIITAAMTLF